MITISGCKKTTYRINPCRNVFLGTYRYYYTGMDGGSSFTSNMTISVPSNDDGNNIYVVIGNSSQGTVYSTNDSTYTSTYSAGGHSGVPNGYYAHDTLIMLSGAYVNTPGGYFPAVEGIAAKY